eukprot:s1104_g28.t1
MASWWSFRGLSFATGLGIHRASPLVFGSQQSRVVTSSFSSHKGKRLPEFVSVGSLVSWAAPISAKPEAVGLDFGLPVYVRVVDDMVVDKFTQSGKMFEINCRLGYPEKDMERILREAQAAEKEREAKKLERKKAAQRPAEKAGTGDSTDPKEKADEPSSPRDKDPLKAEETTASSSSKKKKREVVEEDIPTSTPSKMKKGGVVEDSTTPSARKKKKQDIADEEADEQETTASSTSKKKRREVDAEEVSSPKQRKKKEDVMLNGDSKPRTKEVQVRAKIKKEAAEETQEGHSLQDGSLLLLRSRSEDQQAKRPVEPPTEEPRSWPRRFDCLSAPALWSRFGHDARALTADNDSCVCKRTVYTPF